MNSHALRDPIYALVQTARLEGRKLKTIKVPMVLREALIAEASADRARHGGIPLDERYDFYICGVRVKPDEATEVELEDEKS